MAGLTLLDGAALLWFLLGWLGFDWFVEKSTRGKQSMTARNKAYRRRWMEVMVTRHLRMVDVQIISGLSNGSAFFASASVLILGGLFTLLGATDKVFVIIHDLPFAIQGSRGAFELKVLGLICLFGYAFFKFGWSYRLFNYCAVLVGATPEICERPDVTDDEREEARRTSTQAAEFNILAALHFNRGLRSYFFAVGYLGWFLGPWLFIATTTLVLLVLYRRQFRSRAASMLGS